MSTERKYYIGAGDVHVAPLDANGNPGPFRNLDEAPMFEWDETVEYADNYATGKDGPNVQDLHAVIKRSLALTVQIKEQSLENLALINHGDAETVAAGTVSNEVLPEGFAAGDIYFAEHVNIDVSTAVMTDAAGTPNVLNKGVQYRIETSGRVTFLDLDAADAVKATATITLVSQPNADDTLVVGGKTYTFKASPTTALHIGIGVDKETTATNIANRVNLDTATTLCTAVPHAGSVTLTANTGGTAGNSITLTVDGARLTKVAFANGEAADALTQPFHLAYSHGASRESSVLSTTPPEFCIIFDGTNLASAAGERLYARVDRASLSPATKMPLKSGGAGGAGNTPAEYELKGVGLIAPGKTAQDGYGKVKIY
jgi:hypothetical protein